MKRKFDKFDLIETKGLHDNVKREYKWKDKATSWKWYFKMHTTDKKYYPQYAIKKTNNLVKNG